MINFVKLNEGINLLERLVVEQRKRHEKLLAAEVKSRCTTRTISSVIITLQCDVPVSQG